MKYRSVKGWSVEKRKWKFVTVFFKRSYYKLQSKRYKMETFQLLKTYLRPLGALRSSIDGCKSQAFRITKNILIFAMLTEHAMAVIWFFSFDAQTFREYVESFFYICYALQVLSWYAMHFMNRSKYVEFFAELDGIIAKSKWSAFCTFINYCV